jgi:ADP-heptose:LPS heptosyltransferase
MLVSVGLALVLAQLFRLLSRPIQGEKRRVLVVRLDQTLGDSAMNTPMLGELRAAYPDAHISLVVHPRIRDMVKTCPYVDEVLEYDWGNSLPRSLLVRHYLAARFCWRHLRANAIELALVPRFDEDHHAAFIALFSGARRRIGYSSRVSERKSLLNAGFDKLFTEVIPVDGQVKHEVERNLDMLRHIGFRPANAELELWGSSSDADYAALHVPRVAEEPVYYIGFGLSGGYSPLKRWPVEKYVELARMIAAERIGGPVTYVLVGGKDDIELGRVFEVAHPNTINLIGRTTIMQMHAVLKHVDIFIGNDSGSMHVAAAAGTRVLGIFGSSCNHRFSAWGARCNSVSLELECGPCGQGHRIDRCSTCIHESPRCMDELEPAFVYQQIQPLKRTVIQLSAVHGCSA